MALPKLHSAHSAPGRSSQVQPHSPDTRLLRAALGHDVADHDAASSPSQPGNTDSAPSVGVGRTSPSTATPSSPSSNTSPTSPTSGVVIVPGTVPIRGNSCWLLERDWPIRTCKYHVDNCTNLTLAEVGSGFSQGFYRGSDLVVEVV